MKTATIREAQHHLSKLMAEVAKGHEVILTRRGKQVAKLVPVGEPEDPFSRTVDWSRAMAERDRALGDLPRFQENLVIEMREDERF